MPITDLTAVSNVTSPGGLNQWVLAVGSSKAAAVNSDDSGGGSRINTQGLGIGRTQFLEWTNLPTAARAAAILQVEIETCARRAGGCTTGRFHKRIRDPITTTQLAGITNIPGGGTPCNRQFEVFSTDPNGAVWSQPQVDATQYGVEGGPTTICTGINLYFMVIHITWTGASGSYVVDGASWLGPLLLAGLQGTNLLRESVEQLGFFERNILRPICSKAGVRTYPSLMHPEEREKCLWALFKQPKYVFL